MIKVVELLPTLNIGGAESMVKDYCLLFDKNAIDVKVVVMAERLHTPIEKELEKSGTDVTYLGECIYDGTRTLNPFQKIIRFLGRYVYFRKVIMEYKPDVIHCHLHVGAYFRFVSVKKLGCKMILTVHNVAGRYFDKTSKDKVKHREYREVYRLIHRNNMSLIALHDSMNKELRDYFNTENVITVNNGIETARFCPDLYDRDTIRKNLGIAQGTLVVGNVGRFHEQKNHRLILDVFKKVNERIPDSRLLLVGSGILEQIIREAITKNGLDDKVILLSNRSDVPELMTVMDVFLFPSLWEGFGNVLIEAQCMELPCVVSDAVPVDVIQTGLVKIVGLDESVDQWVDAVVRASLMRDSKSKDASAHRLREQFDICNSVKKIQRIYLDLVS